MRKVYFFIAVMCLTAVQTVNAQLTQTIDGITYKLNNEAGTAIVTYQYYNSESNYSQLKGEVVIPSTVHYVNDYTVTAIDFSAFENATGITSLILPNTLKEIGEYAFHECSNLKKVFLPNSLTYLGSYAFRSCTSLETINIPTSLKSMQTYAFSYCQSVKQFYVPATMDTIADMVFSYNTKLTDIYLMRTTPPVTNKMPWYSGQPTKPTLHVPYGCANAYKADTCWNKMEIVEMTKPSYDGFYYEFNETDKTAAITNELPYGNNNNYISHYDAISLPQKVKKGANTYDVTAVGDKAFAYNRSIQSVAVPQGYTMIGKSAFESCDRLEEISMPESVTAIGDFCFNLCKQLKSVVLPEGVESLGSLVFYQCEGLTSVSLPATLQTIGEGAFDGCTALAELTNLNPEPQDISDKEVFNKVDVKKVILRVPAGSVKKYKEAAVWKDFIVEEAVTGLEEIGANAMNKARKVMRDNRLLIELSDNRVVDVTGREVE